METLSVFVNTQRTPQHSVLNYTHRQQVSQEFIPPELELATKVDWERRSSLWKEQASPGAAYFLLSAAEAAAGIFPCLLADKPCIYTCNLMFHLPMSFTVSLYNIVFQCCENTYKNIRAVT